MTPMACEPLWRRLSGRRRCPVCGAKRLTPWRRCPSCGLIARRTGREAALAAGTLLEQRYAVGGLAAPACGAGGGTPFWGYDRQERCVVSLTAYAVPAEARGAYVARQAALQGLSSCPSVTVPLALLPAGDFLVAVAPAPVQTLADARVPMDGGALLTLLNRLADALLVVHSLDGQMGGGAAVHGAPSAGTLWRMADGEVRLFVPPVPAEGSPVDDIRGFGSVLTVLSAGGGALSPALVAVLERMCAGGYASVLEIKHELNCL